jgi:hypothetical protein
MPSYHKEMSRVDRTLSPIKKVVRIIKVSLNDLNDFAHFPALRRLNPLAR